MSLRLIRGKRLLARAFTLMDRRRPRHIPSRPLVLVVEDHDDTRELTSRPFQSSTFARPSFEFEGGGA